MRYTEEDRAKAATEISSAITRCERMQPKFAEGTPQSSLLRNRLRALYLSKALIEGANAAAYSREELEAALPPVRSIHHKTSAAQGKYARGTVMFRRFEGLIRAMEIAEAYLEAALDGQGDKRKMK